jgi:hypothetical protein
MSALGSWTRTIAIRKGSNWRNRSVADPGTYRIAAGRDAAAPNYRKGVVSGPCEVTMELLIEVNVVRSVKNKTTDLLLEL